MATKQHEWVAHYSAVTCVAVGCKTWQVLVSGGEDKRVNVWKLRKGEGATTACTLGGHSSAISCVALDEEEKELVSGAVGGSVRLYDVEAGACKRALNGHRNRVNDVHSHPFGDFVASGGADSQVKIWDARRKACIQTYKGQGGEVECVRFSPDGKWVASCGRDDEGCVRLWDLTAGKLLAAMPVARERPQVSATHLEFSPKEFIMAAAGTDRVVRLYDLEVFAALASTPPDATSQSRALAFSPQGDSVVAVTDTGLRQWTKWDAANPRLALFDTVGWDDVKTAAVTDAAVCLAASYAANFVSLWACPIDPDPTPGDPATDAQSLAQKKPIEIVRRLSSASRGLAAENPDAARLKRTPLSSKADASSRSKTPATSRGAGGDPEDFARKQSPRRSEAATRPSRSAENPETKQQSADAYFLPRAEAKRDRNAADRGGGAEAKLRAKPSAAFLDAAAKNRVFGDAPVADHWARLEGLASRQRANSSSPDEEDRPLRSVGVGLAKQGDDAFPLHRDAEEHKDAPEADAKQTPLDPAESPRDAATDSPRLADTAGLLTEMLLGRATTRALEARLEGLKVASRHWAAADVARALQSLKAACVAPPLADLDPVPKWCLVSDFLANVDFDPPTLDLAVDLLAILDPMLADYAAVAVSDDVDPRGLRRAAPRHLVLALDAVLRVADLFADYVVATLDTPVVGVDLAREDRRRRCEHARRLFVAVARNLPPVRRTFSTHRRLDDVALRLETKLRHSFRSTPGSAAAAGGAFS